MGRIEVKNSVELRRRIVCKRSSDSEKEYKKLIAFDSPRIIRPVGIQGDCIIFPEYAERAADGIAGYCSEREAWRFLRDVAEGLAYLHERNVLHMDIQPANVLISEQGYVIGDFDDEGDRNSFAFTPPEWHEDRTLLGPASDVWSLGASVFYLLNGSFIFSGRGGAAQRKDTLVPRLSEKYTEELMDIVARCLDYEMKLRPSVDEIYALATIMAERAEKPVARRKTVHSHKPAGDFEKLWPEQMEQ